MDNDTRHHSGQNVVDHCNDACRCRSEYKPRETTFRFVFYQNINVKENGFFFTAQAEKGIAWHIDASSVVWTLIDNGKLANQIARLVAIVVKSLLYTARLKK